MIPGEVITKDGDIELNAGQPTVTLDVANTGDRPIQVGSHSHFAETNAALAFDRQAALRQVAEPLVFVKPEILVVAACPGAVVAVLTVAAEGGVGTPADGWPGQPPARRSGGGDATDPRTAGPG